MQKDTSGEMNGPNELLVLGQSLLEARLSILIVQVKLAAAAAKQLGENAYKLPLHGTRRHPVRQTCFPIPDALPYDVSIDGIQDTYRVTITSTDPVTVRHGNQRATFDIQASSGNPYGLTASIPTKTYYPSPSAQPIEMLSCYWTFLRNQGNTLNIIESFIVAGLEESLSETSGQQGIGMMGPIIPAYSPIYVPVEAADLRPVQAELLELKSMGRVLSTTAAAAAAINFETYQLIPNFGGVQPVVTLPSLPATGSYDLLR